MERDWNWPLILLRGLGPVGAASIWLVLLAGLAAQIVGQQVLDWAFALAVVLLLAGILLTFWQLRRWERGRACCPKCGGPLGWWPHMGRRYYGKQLPDFHRCWNCGKASPVE